ncbi:MAG: hypothetical protein QOG28_5094, partial [Trebonia sp.]|nr:hypothetical protein [Trebonia sp.]
MVHGEADLQRVAGGDDLALASIMPTLGMIDELRREEVILMVPRPKRR